MWKPFDVFRKKSNTISIKDSNDMLTASKLSKEFKAKADIISFDLAIEKRKELFVSLDSILTILQTTQDFTVENIISKCRHISELTGHGTQTTVYAIPSEDGDHITLCQDIATCSIHKGISADKIQLTMLKKVQQK